MRAEPVISRCDAIFTRCLEWRCTQPATVAAGTFSDKQQPFCHVILAAYAGVTRRVLSGPCMFIPVSWFTPLLHVFRLSMATLQKRAHTITFRVSMVPMPLALPTAIAEIAVS